MTQDLMKLVDAFAESVTQRTIVRRVNARAAVIAALDQLTKDAGRYQWLRMNLDDSIVMYGDTSEAQLMGEEDLDAAIDAAIAAQKEQS